MIQPFNFHQPTKLRFGYGCVQEIVDTIREYDSRCLIVTVPEFEALVPALTTIKNALTTAGISVDHFDGVVPNPTTDSIHEGAVFAEKMRADCIIGFGGGSSIDTAKAIAVEASHDGVAWDYLYCSPKQPTHNVLPVIAIPTTSGTGSHVTQVAVLTNPHKKCKSALFNSYLFPRESIIDPALMVSVPPTITASTGFDVFAHAFESYLHRNASVYTDTLALTAIETVIHNLPIVVENGTDIEARTAMAWADTLAGIAIGNAGVTLPHGIGMTVGGYCPHVMHGAALAVLYPEFTRYTYPHAIERFAKVGRLFNPDLNQEEDPTAAEQSCVEIDSFLKNIGLWQGFEKLHVAESHLSVIADNSTVLPDYKNNPKVATRDEIYQMITNSFKR